LEVVIGTNDDIFLATRITQGQDGDRINAVLAAAGFNFHLLLRWLAALLRAIFLAALVRRSVPQPA
jgi:IS5 family transposase